MNKISCFRRLKMITKRTVVRNKTNKLLIADLTREVKIPGELLCGNLLCMDLFKDEKRRGEIDMGD